MLSSETTLSLSFPRARGRTYWAINGFFASKKNIDGSITRYIAQLVAKGFHQQPSIDFHKTFSPVINHISIRTVLSITLHRQWGLCQLDVNNAFLNGHLTEEVFMAQPQGMRNAEYPHHVCRLHKAIYGLKQAPRA